MSELFLGPIGQKIFYLILVVYLYGDLSIYAVTIPTSIMVLSPEGWKAGSWSVSQDNVYYIYLTMFAFCIIPWTFFNFQKTKILQFTTVITRNVALFMMIIITLIFIGEGEGSSPSTLPSSAYFNISGLPSLFGVSIYAFMCHHSLPSLLTPVKNKSRLNSLMAFDFITIYLVYGGLCISALFAFGQIKNPVCLSNPSAPCSIQELYTLNFTSYDFVPIAYFLSLYPVFTLSANFPLIAITLRNNLMLLFPFGENSKRSQIIFSLIATLPPIAIAFATRNVGILVGITGSYAGLGIMFIIPAFLVMYSRRAITRIARDSGMKLDNPYKSPFGHQLWIIIILIACVAAMVLVTFEHIYRAVKNHEM